MAQNDKVELIRSEEELLVRMVEDEVGRVTIRKVLETVDAETTVSVQREHLDLERTAAAPDDDGQVHTLDDGSLSIPVFHEELVVQRRWVVAERVTVRKATVTQSEAIKVPLKRERITVDTEPAVTARVRPTSRRPGRPLRSPRS